MLKLYYTDLTLKDDGKESKAGGTRYISSETPEDLKEKMGFLIDKFVREVGYNA